MDSSDEDVPLIQRNTGVFFNKSNPVVVNSDDDDSPLPSWLGQPKPAGKGNTTLIDSDSDSDDIKEVISPVKLIGSSPTKHQQPTFVQDTGAAAIAGAGTSAAAPPKVEHIEQPPASAKKPTPNRKKAPTPAKNIKPASEPNDGAGPSQPAANATQTQTQTAATARTITGLPVSSSCIPVVIPDRIPQIKVLLELESTDELHGATDLSGDSGAIGRVLVNSISNSGGASGSGNGTHQQQLQIDLKGEDRKINILLTSLNFYPP
jgi:hypothetical protein